MKFVLACGGSRGDVQPAVAVGLELTRRGHQVTMAVPPDLLDFSAGTGLPSVGYGAGTREVLDSELVHSDLKSANPRSRLRAITALTVRSGRLMQQQLLDLTVDADAVIATSTGQERAHNVTQARGIPHIPLHYCPLRPNRSVSLFTHLGFEAPPWIRRPSWRAVEQVLWRATRSAEDSLREELGLPATSRPFADEIAAARVPEIQAYDPALFPALPTEWIGRRPLVGFLNLDATQRNAVGDSGLTEELAGWIEAGEKPVYVGFGSMLPSDPEGLAAAIGTVAARRGLRLLVAGGWSGFMADSDDARVRVVGHVDHDAVLPRCRAAVHHGGAGTVAAGLRAGLPTLITWVGADQPMWGRAIVDNHLGASIPMARVSADRLGDALDTVLSRPVAANTRELRDRLITPAAAAGSTADIVERVVSEGSRQRPV